MMQGKFRVNLPGPQDVIEGRSFIPRKPHQKSREGCEYCKKQRRKCDEAKPSCERCVKKGIECIYPVDTSRMFPKTLFLDERDPVTPTVDMYSMSVDLLTADLDVLFSPTMQSSHYNEPFASLRILQHFQTLTVFTLGSEINSQLIFNSMATSGLQFPYVMHIIMALSSAHLKRLYANAEQMKLHTQISVVEVVHWQRGLELYKRELAGTTSPNFDAALTATFLIIIFTFSLDDEISENAFDHPGAESRHAISPLAATGGFRALREIFGGYMHDSVWKFALMESDDSRGTFSNSDQIGVDALPLAFIELCDLGPKSTSQNNKYYHIVRLLTPLLHLDPGDNNVCKLLAFCGRTWPSFRDLLEQWDTIALLLLSYWLASLTQIDQWWVVRRAKTACAALVSYLRQLQHPQIDALLMFPASLGRVFPPDFWSRESP